VRVTDGRISRQGIGLGTFEKRLVSACEDRHGGVWLYTANGELWRYWNTRFTPFRFELFRPSACRVIIAEPGGPLWIGADWRQSAISSMPDLVPLELQIDQDLPLARLDFLLASARGGYWRLADGRIQKWRTNRVEQDFGFYPWGGDAITAACEDPEGGLWVGTRGSGVYRIGLDSRVSQLSTRHGLSHNSVLSLCVDREGSLWIGTDGGGLNRARRQVFRVLPVFTDVAVAQVQSVSEDREGRLWVGARGGGITCWQSGVSQWFGPNLGLTNLDITTVFADRQMRLWAGTSGGDLFLLQAGRFESAAGSKIITGAIWAIHEDRQGRLWLGTLGGLACWDDREWRVWTTLDGLSADEVRALADDPSGALWIGTMGGGLNRWQDGRFTVYRKKDGLPSEHISSLHLDGDGVLWIGTFGSGLGRFHKGQWTSYTTLQGLPSNSIGYMVEDGQGYLWIGSNAGLVRVQKAELNRFAQGLTHYVPCRAYGKPDGLPTRECTLGSQPGGCRTLDGQLWFPTVKGLVSVHPNQLEPNRHRPPVVIEAVYADGQLQNTNSLRPEFPQPLVIAAGKEHLEIHYTSLNLAAPDRGRFQYRLDGYEKNWTEARNSRVARYSRLPGGRYQFHVKACNEDGIWNEEGSTLALVVRPPFWRTGWFLSLASLAILGTIVATVHYASTQKLQRQVERLRQQEALDKDRARIAQDIHDQLGASLTQVALLGELVRGDKDQPDEVEAHAQQISQTARDTTRVLDEIVWAVNPANDTLDGLLTYICKHAQDFLSVAGLRYRLDFPEPLPAINITPELRHNVFLAFKEAVTNIARHAKATTVTIRLLLDANHFVLEIVDNGRGLPDLDEKTVLTRNGLRGMRKRMEAIGGSFTIDRGTEGGTCVRLSAPLNPMTATRT
jgi:ligand-binding sensor domain-containing protein/signal transduction histidine kinase